MGRGDLRNDFWEINLTPRKSFDFCAVSNKTINL